MHKIRTLPAPFNLPEHALKPIIQHGVIMPYQPEIRLEMLRIHRVETHKSRVREEIELRELGAQDIRTAVGVD